MRREMELARQFGVHSAMPTSTARRLCPEAVFLPVRMDHYAAVARQLLQIFLSRERDSRGQFR